MKDDYGISNIDATLTDPLSELQVQELIVTENRSNVVVPKPTEKFYKELEEILQTLEFQFQDLVGVVRTIIANYEPADIEMYTMYMLVAMANDYRWVRCSNKRVRPAIILRVEDTLEKIITEYNIESETTLTEARL